MEILNSIAKEISKKGGKTFYVGGFVRDSILGIDNKDIDVEIYGITPEELKKILSNYGEIDEIGATFGVLKIHGVDIDFTMPRRENKTGNGHKGFNVSVDPFMGTLAASKRRDFTINALMKNAISGEIVDHWGGIKDLESGVIRHINDVTFVEDELRALRACQFASRFGFSIAPETIELCKSFNLTLLPKERIMGELEKGLLKGKRPSIFFENLRKMELLEQVFSPMEMLDNIPQNSKHHPEGSVWNHTMMVIDKLAEIKSNSNHPLALMLAGVCHDFGKISATSINERGEIVAYNHENDLSFATDFLKGLTEEKDLIISTLNLVKNHMRPNALVFNGSDKAIKRLIVDSQIARTNVQDLLLLGQADHLGRGFTGATYDKQMAWLQDKINSNSSDGNIKPIVTGKDLINLGFKPGKGFKSLLDKAFDMQIDGMSKDDIISRLVS